jgi:uncharacterized damage-inducible protein DinB
MKNARLALSRGSVMYTRPQPNDYPSYYETYVKLVPDGDIEETLQRQQQETIAFLNKITEEESEQTYAPGKWTLKEVVGHISDIERVMAYRLFAIARGEKKTLQGMDQDAYVASANFNQYSWSHLLNDFSTVRSATLSLMATIDDQSWTRLGTMLDYPVTPHALVFIIAGHELHHLKIISVNYL